MALNNDTCCCIPEQKRRRMRESQQTDERECQCIEWRHFPQLLLLFADGGGYDYAHRIATSSSVDT